MTNARRRVIETLVEYGGYITRLHAEGVERAWLA